MSTRIKRPPLPARGPNRKGSAGGGGGAPPPPPKDPDQSLGEAAARSVRAGYEAIAANILQGREAAAKFRQGQYNMRTVPEDLEKISGRMQKLANEFSTTGIEFLNWLINSAEPLATAAGGLAGSHLMFAVRPAQPRPANKEFTVLTQSLVRPTGSVRVNDLSADALRPRGTAKGKPIAVRFETDLSVGALLVAVVTVPPNQIAGVYSGSIYAKDVDAPIGQLSIQIP